VHRVHLLLALCCLTACVSCAPRAPLPTLPAPTPTPREDPLPELPLSSMVIPLSVPLALVQELVHERLTLPSVHDWLQVTGEGDNPELSIRYQAELGELGLALEGPLVHTTVPIHYFGSFRARADTPFGSLWLTKNTSWGSRERPGTITLQISSRLALSPNWQLGASSVLDDVLLTAPDVDKLCAGKVFRVCVPIELATGRVHAELDKRVRARAAEGLAELDAQLAARADLEGLARRVWERLQASRPAAGGAALALVPERMSLSYPTREGDALSVALQVWARPSWNASVAPELRPLPAATEPSAVQDEVHYALPVSYGALSLRLSAALTVQNNEEGYRISELKLLGPAAGAGRWLWAATLSSARDTAQVYGECALRVNGASVSLVEIQLPEPARPLLKATGFSDEQLAQKLSAPAELTQELGERVSDLRGLLSESVSPWPVRPLAAVNSALEAAHAARDGVVFSVSAR
jgi:hypothetical protein